MVQYVTERVSRSPAAWSFLRRSVTPPRNGVANIEGPDPGLDKVIA